ncbi:MAG: endonuclease/exonuclease/phosphatase family protein [Saprospiraceae bacterium]|nr:endonuclease/exonuclease/phosphatase family protein [Saprospiraceae bacterium]
MRKVGIISFLMMLQWSLWSQNNIQIDGLFNDWSELDPVYIDETGDGQNNGIDIKRVWAYNDDVYLYFRFELTKEINLQENNELAIYIDFDHDINTGFKINGIGAELRYFFGDRFGVIEEGDDIDFVSFLPIEMLVAPSVSSTEFEVSIAREINVSGINISSDTEISFRIEDNSFNGDEAPSDLFGIEYAMNNTNELMIDDVNLSRSSNTEFRLLSYNIENDQLFDPSRRLAFQRIFQALQPDIIALQEVRDFNSLESKNIIEDFLPGETWYHKKHGFDIVTVSKYPILFSESVDGNAAFFLDVNGQKVLLINCHLPCCDNDSDRQTEVDIIMEYIRELKEGNGNYSVEEGTPIIIAGDMNFVGDSNQPHTFLTGDILSNGFYGPDFMPDWDDTNLKDANPYSTNTISNFTWFNPNGSFFPGKLDWIIYTDSRLNLENTFSLYTPSLPSSILAENNLLSGDVIQASDHMPIIGDFAYSTVNTNDLLDIDFALYPNPASTNINIDAGNQIFNKLKVMSEVGQTLLEKNELNSSLITIDVSSLSTGKYFLVLYTQQGRLIKPFLKIK